MKIKVGGKTEFERFENMLDALLVVPHSEIKAALDAEKKAKERKKRKSKSSASGRASKSSP
jgi:hypothetical protein